MQENTVPKTAGQIALENAPTLSNGKVRKVPTETLREVLSLHRGGVPLSTIGEKYGITEANAYYYVRRAEEVFNGKNARSRTEAKPSVKAATKAKTEGKACWLAKEDAAYVDALAVVMGVTAREAFSVIVKKFKENHMGMGA